MEEIILKTDIYIYIYIYIYGGMVDSVNLTKYEIISEKIDKQIDKHIYIYVYI